MSTELEVKNPHISVYPFVYSAVLKNFIFYVSTYNMAVYRLKMWIFQSIKLRKKLI